MAHRGSLALLTSDEEGPSVDGTVKVVEWLLKARACDGRLHRRRTHLVEKLGTMKNSRAARSRRKLTVQGVQGRIAIRNWVATPSPPRRHWRNWRHDLGPPATPSPPTSWRDSNITPARAPATRHPGCIGGGLQFPLLHRSTHRCRPRVHRLPDRHGATTTLDWTLGGGALHDGAGELRRAPRPAIAPRRRITTPPPAVPATGASSRHLPATDRIRAASTPAIHKIDDGSGWPTSSPEEHLRRTKTHVGGWLTVRSSTMITIRGKPSVPAQTRRGVSLATAPQRLRRGGRLVLAASACRWTLDAVPARRPHQKRSQTSRRWNA